MIHISISVSLDNNARKTSDSSAPTDGPYFGLRGNTFTRNANQHGIAWSCHPNAQSETITTAQLAQRVITLVNDLCNSHGLTGA